MGLRCQQHFQVVVTSAERGSGMSGQQVTSWRCKLSPRSSVGCGVVARSCLTLCDPVDCSPPDPSVQGILQARCWDGFPRPPPGDLPQPRMEPGSPVLQADSLPSKQTREALIVVIKYHHSPCVEHYILVAYLFYTEQFVSLSPLSVICLAAPTLSSPC